MKHEPIRALILMAAAFAATATATLAQSDLQQRMASQTGAAAGAGGTAAPTRAAGVAAVPADFAKLKLAPGFLLNLKVLDDPDFTGAFRVDEEGNVALPVLGTLHLSGLTVTAAREKIREKLQGEKILNSPQVELSILEYSAPEVTIVGEVARPGTYPLLVAKKLVDVLAMAGGATIAAGNEVQITPGNPKAEPLLVQYSKVTSAKTLQDALVHPGDTVQVKRAGIVYVLGAVTRPGGYVMQEQGTLSVLQAISLANGLTLMASPKTIYLLRRNADGTVVDIALPFNKMQHGKSADVQLQAADILYAPTSKVKSIFTYNQSVLTSAASASIYAGLLY